MNEHVRPFLVEGRILCYICIRQGMGENMFQKG